jgi:hypothetical protein
MFRGKHFGALENGARMRIAAPHLRLLFIGESHHPQRQHLIHLGSVEEIAGALRSDLRVIVQNNRRAQHMAAIAFIASHHRKNALIATRRDLSLHSRGRIEQRDEGPALDVQQQMRGCKGACLRIPARHRFRPCQRRFIR